MAKTTKTRSSNWSLLMPVVTGAIGVVIGGLVDWKKEDKLGDKAFEYGIIQEALKAETQQETKEKLSFLLDVKMITSVDTAALRKKVSENDLPYKKGFDEGRAMKSLIAMIGDFYRIRKRVPFNMTELKDTYPINNNINMLDENRVLYRAFGEQKFELRFAYNDNVLFTEDDKTYTFADLKIDQP